jgi:outer membrane immunogenic protein
MLIRAFCGAVMLCGAAASLAHAADQSAAAPHAPFYYYPDTYYPAAVQWTGFYLGPSFGGVFSATYWNDPYSHYGDAVHGSSIFGGGQIGANWQMDSLVLGAEWDFEWMSLGGSATDPASFEHLVSSHWLSTVTGRIGWAINAMLVYFKGGVAFASERDIVDTPLSTTASTGTETRGGWTIGGGVEYAFDPHWSARLEYDHILIDTPGEFLNGTAGGANGSTDWVINRVLGGVNYRF